MLDEAAGPKRKISRFLRSRNSCLWEQTDHNCTQPETNNESNSTNVILTYDSPTQDIRSLVNIEQSKNAYLLYANSTKDHSRRSSSFRSKWIHFSESSQAMLAKKFHPQKEWNAESIDELCQKLFPILFAILNAAYWWYYTKQQD